MEESVYQIALSLLPKIGPITARQLVGYCGGVKEVFTTRKKDLLRIPGIGPKLSNTIRSGKVLEEAASELERLSRNQVRVLFYLDPDYPQRLKAFEDSPVCLYYRGEGALNPARSVGIVGTRKPSSYGIAQCERLVRGLASYGVTVVSGLAYGIDSTAHRTACSEGIPTLGVLAHGLGSIYPKVHERLARSMLSQGGLLSEHPFATLPEREFFPMRNRIIAGMCDALVVIESGKTGGSLITAEFANRYHREVLAVPGRVSDERSAGCHLLIKNHKAALLEDAADLARLLRWEEEDTNHGRQTALSFELEGPEKIIVDLLNDSEPKPIDRITAAVQLSPSETAALLLELECRGLIKALPGKQFALNR